jgi:hypothetical protein
MAHEPESRENDPTNKMNDPKVAGRGFSPALPDPLPYFAYVVMLAAAVTGWLWLVTRGPGPAGPTLSMIYSFLKVAWWAPGLALFIIGVVVWRRLRVLADEPPEKTGDIFRLARDVGIDKPFSEWTKEDWDRVVERHFQGRSATYGGEYAPPANDS